MLRKFAPSFKTSTHADVAKLVDALDLGSSAARHGGSSPSIRTQNKPSTTLLGVCFYQMFQLKF